MKKEILRKWIDALRSEEYSQVQDWLKFYIAGKCYFCATGVLCDLYSKETGKEWEEEPEQRKGPAFIYDEEQSIPPEIIEWAEFSHSGGPIYMEDGEVFISLKKRKYHQGIATLNDTGSTFHQIANKLEEVYKRL